ncbi:MAG: tetratricopeptide (TPR) repeat protein, partial [Gammaproteobacteria bacterium]
AFFSKESGDKLGEDLLAFAADRDDSMKRRAAIVLGLQGVPAKALELYVVDHSMKGKGADTARFRQEARLAEWAIQAENASEAQAHAWEAATAAKLGRDRNYAMTLLVEAYRMGENTTGLIDRFAAASDAGELTHEGRSVWVELLREEGRIDEAIALFEDAGNTDETLIGKTADLAEATQRKLIEIYREDDRTDEMIAAYKKRIAAEPDRLTWREGLSRFYLERGKPAEAEAVWSSFVDGEDTGTGVFDEETLLLGFSILSNLGLDDLAITAANRAIEARRGHLSACLHLFALHQDRGRLDLAEAALEQLESLAAEGEPARLDLAEAWERLGRLDRAVEVLEGVVAVRGAAESGEDLAMHLAWLYSEVGDEDKAMVAWRELWTRVNALARRRYVEDRLMTVASRLGKLADIAIDLEQSLLDGTATERETGLLVRLYSKVGDPVSASEIIDEFLRTSGGDAVDALQEKARVYLSCTDFYHYERTVKELIEIDPDGKPDYLRQLAMSQLERGKPEDARDILRQLKDLEGEGSDAAEFEAGVLALAGLKDEAILAYQKGIAGDANRIESWLMLGNLLKESGQTQRAIRIFQHLAETAEKDDLFTIAIDGLLNLEANGAVLSWAKRITFERIAGRNDRAYLYQLVADLAEANNDTEGVLIALESSLSIAGERRSSILRELVDRAAGSQDVWNPGAGGDKQKHLAFSRRLVGLGEIVPPDVFLNLGEVFLEAGDPTAAMRTFRMARDLPDPSAFDRQTAAIFEGAGYAEEALSTYERVLVAEPSSSGLLVKVAEMHERLGHFETAADLYVRGTELQLSRQPASSTKEEQASTLTGARSWWGARNIDDFDRYFQRNVMGVLAVLGEQEGQALAAAQKDLVLAELAKELADLEANADQTEVDVEDETPKETLGRFPRSFHRAALVRQLAFAFGAPELAHEMDLALLDAHFPTDEALLPTLVRDRLQRGQVASARALLDGTTRATEATAPLRFLVGQGAEQALPKEVTVEETMRLLLPLIIDGKNGDAAVLLGRTNLGKDANAQDVRALLSAAMYIGDQNLSLRFGRNWLLSMFETGTSSWQMRPVLEELETILEYKEYRGICQLLASKATEDPEKGQALLEMLPALQAKFEEPLISSEDLRDLIDVKDDLGWGWGIGPVIMLLPEAERTSALRSALPRMDASHRSRFLIEMISTATQPMGPALSEYIGEVFPATLEEAELDMIRYYAGQLGEVSENFDAALAVCEGLLGVDAKLHAARSSRIALLEKTDRLDEALAFAREDWALVANDADYNAQNVKRAIEALLTEHDFDALLALMEETPSDNPDQDLVNRIHLMRRNDREQQAATLLAKALEEQPESVLFQKTQLTVLRGSGDRPAIVACYKRIIELEPDEVSHQEALMHYYLGLHDSIHALEIRETLPTTDKAEAESLAGSIPGFAGLILPAGAVMVISGVSYTGGETSTDKDQPTIAGVKKLAESGDEAGAATMLRRLWRAFPTGISGQDRYGRMSFGAGNNTVPNWTWPADKVEVTADQEPIEEVIYRGGFAQYKQYEKPEPVTRVSAFVKMAHYDFGVREMQRLLRTRASSALNSSVARDLIGGLLDARITAASAAVVRDELLATINGDQAGKIEHVMLLQLLDDNPDLLDANAELVLEELARTLQTGDLGPLRALARLYARRDSADSSASALRIYRWCASKVQPITGYFPMDGGGELIDARDLLAEVKETLTGDELLSVTEEILFFATSSEDDWDRGRGDLFVLQTWMDMVPADEALARCEPFLGQLSSTEFDAAPARELGKLAVTLYLEAGQTERALTCFEIGLAKFDRSLFPGVVYLWPNPESPGYISNQDLARFFPEDSSSFQDSAAWYRGLASKLAEWLDSERISISNAARFSAFAALRLAELGETDSAIEIVTAVLAWDDLPRGSSLYLVDAARAAGAADLANATERTLFEKDELILERVQELVARVLESEGPEAALDLGDTLTSYTLHPRLLEVLVRAAQAHGDPVRLAAITDLQTRAEAASARLEELDRAEAEAMAKDD